MTHAPGSPGPADPEAAGPDATFQVAVGVYAGTVLAGFVATILAVWSVTPISVVEGYTVGFVAGLIGGVALARVDRVLPIRLGRTLVRRLTLVLPAGPIGLVAVVAWIVPLEGGVDAVAIPSAIAVFAAGYALSQLAGNRYVDAVVAGEPEGTWGWEPPGSAVLDAGLAVSYVALAAANAYGENWLQVLLWSSVAVLWVGGCLVEGRWSFGPGRSRCEVRLYGNGLVKRYPYTQSFVAWADVDHVRLRDGELVLDRGLQDVRFDRAALEDPDAVFEAIERRLHREAVVGPA